MNPDLNDKLAAAREPDLDPDFATMEAGVLVGLARTINDDQAEARFMILGDLTEGDFQREDRRTAFRAMKALYYRGEGVDGVTVAAWAKENATPLRDAEVAAVFDAEGGPDQKVLESYVRRLAERGRLQAARRVVGELSAAINAPGADVDAVAAKVQSIAHDMTTDRRLVGRAPTESDELPRFLADLEKRNDGRKFAGLDTGFDELNCVTGGLGQALVIVGGPPSCGKTTFLKQLADQVAEKNDAPVLFYTYEQPAEDLRVKTLARLSGVDSQSISRGQRAGRFADKVDVGLPESRKNAEASFGKAVARYMGFGRHISLVEAGRETTVDRIRLQATAAKAKANADRVLVVVDYIQLIPAVDPLTGKAFPSVRERTDYVCSELRRLARDLDSPVVAISSLNRGGYSADKLDAFKESGGIEYGADVAILLKTSGIRDDAVEESRWREIDARIVKNRGGAVGSIPLRFYPAKARFSEAGRFSPEDYMKNIGGSE